MTIALDDTPLHAVTLHHATPTHSPSGIPLGRHCAADLVWYGSAIARLDKGSPEGPRAPRCLLAAMQREAAAVSAGPTHWLAPTAAELAETKARADAIGRTLAAVARECAEWERLLREAWVTRGGRIDAEPAAYYADLGTACSTHGQRETWTSRKGVYRTERAGTWARGEMAKATEAYDRLRVQQGGL